MIAHLMYIFSYTNEKQKWIRSLWPSHTPGATWDGRRNSHEGARAYQGGRSLGHASATAMIWHTIDLIYYVIFIRHTHTYRENKIRPSNILFVRVPYIFGPMFQAQTYIYVCIIIYIYMQHEPFFSAKYTCNPCGSLQEIPVKAAPPEVKELEAVWYELLDRTVTSGSETSDFPVRLLAASAAMEHCSTQCPRTLSATFPGQILQEID